MKKLFTKNNPKTDKSVAFGWLPLILMLAPAKRAFKKTKVNMCEWASKACNALCLNTSGHGQFDRTQEARVERTVAVIEDMKAGFPRIRKELDAHVKRAEKLLLEPCVRMDGTSDRALWWMALYGDYPMIKFYGYTKDQYLMQMFMDGKLPPNVHLTFSRSEDNWEFCQHVLNSGFNVAAVFEVIPKKYEGWETVDSTIHDCTFLWQKRKNSKGRILGLVPKGKMKKDKSGFVIRKGDK